MQHLEVSCAVRHIYKSLGFKGLMCPKFLYDFHNIWIFSTDFHKSPQIEISHKSVH